MTELRQSSTRALVCLACLVVTGGRSPVFAGNDTDSEAQRRGREIAEKFIADYFGEHSTEHRLFVESAKTDRSLHFPGDGKVVTFFDDELAVMVSTTLGRVMSLEFRNVDRRTPCTPDDEAAFAPGDDYFVNDVRRFLDATAPEVDLAALTPTPYVGLCRGGGPVSSHTWRELPDDDGVFYESTRVEVGFNLFTKEITGFTVQTLTWDGPINVDAVECREIVERIHGDRPGFEITRQVLIRVFPLEGPAYPAWVASVDVEPANKMGLTWGSMGFGVQVHALTGEIIDDLKEYKAEEPAHH